MFALSPIAKGFVVCLLLLIKEHKLMTTHFCPAFCPNTNYLSDMVLLYIILLESTCIGVGPGFFSMSEINLNLLSFAAWA